MNIVRVIEFLTNNNPSYVTRDFLSIYYDAGAFVVKLNNVTITSGDTLTTGETTTNSGTRTVIYEYRNFDPGYKFCTSDDLTYFTFISNFPYVKLNTQTNSPSCVTSGGGHVCNLIAGLPTITSPTDDTTSDGQISITATSDGTVKYALEDLDYALMPNSTGTFTGLSIGDYTVYIKDSYGCVVIKNITLTAIFDYGVIYRINYKNLALTDARIDILKRGYTGSVTILETVGDSPIVLYMRGENTEKFNALFSTEAEVNVMSLTDGQFVSFFTDYEHQFICKFYKDLGSGLTEIWRGANMPGLYTDPFNFTPYPVTIQFTDQTALLGDYLFVDDNQDNFTGKVKLIKLLALLLAKTGLQLPIRCGINIYDAGMATGVTDDPLDQTYIDLDCFYDEDYTNPKDYKFILTEILKPFAARLVQCYGYWWILENDGLTTTFKYRDFDKNGDYVTHGTYSEVVTSSQASATDRIVWSGQSQNLEIIRSFGKLIVKQSTDPRTSVIPNFGFEKPLIVEDQIPDWSLLLNGCAETAFIFNRDDDNKGNISVNVDPNIQVSSLVDLKTKTATSRAVVVLPTDQSLSYPQPTSEYYNSYLFSKPLDDVTIDPLDNIEFSIDFYKDIQRGFGNVAPSYIGFRYIVQLGDWLLVEKSSNVDNSNLGSTILTAEELRSVATVSLSVGATTSFNDILSNVIKTYRLISGTNSDDGIIYLRPADYNSSTNAKVWQLYQYDNWINVNTGNLGWNEVWIKDPSEGWDTKKIESQMPPVAATGQRLVVKIMPMWYSPVSIPSIEAIETTGKNLGFIITSRAIGADIAPAGLLNLHIHYDEYYELVVPVPDTDVQTVNLAGLITFDVPINGALKPNDWNKNTNNVYWRHVAEVANKIVSDDQPDFNFTFFYANGSISAFDNIIVKFKPKAQSNTSRLGNFTIDAPKEQNFILTTSSKIKNTINYEVFLGDASLLVNNAKYIYRNFFTLSDNTPTYAWTREGIAENDTLIALLCKRFLQQYANPTYKLSGTFETRYSSGGTWVEKQVSFISTILQNSHYLLPYYMEIDDKNCAVKVETIEVIPKTSTATAAFDGAFSQTNFGNAFNI
jgi:hypothetical protein